ncbi:hypothetical protein [Paenibacillus lutimineralis]|uniref:Uncharacterized protein n=1 Tax=Paenibacillus lutimineralis TaxID=2707005 RepID=A0A3S9UYB2_9BACL|nr:hypothetical protein [Paenibacillus lutimineralis]AZS15323.1 hypothetical protein EI981_13200 [Paenibacillus lutimineralis]
MDREMLVAQALEAGQAAKHNLEMIMREPERMVSSKKLVDGIAYLNTMIKFAEAEVQTKNDRRPGQSNLRTRLKSLLLSILLVERREGKGETA